MKQRVLFATLVLCFTILGGVVLAQEDHPTVRAASRFAHRKVMGVSHVAHHVHQSYRHWKKRKGHNIRAWLNNH